MKRFGPSIAVAALTLLATQSTAFADVIDSGHTVTTNVVTNPCDPADGPITITTDTRWETRLQPDGTVISHFLNHSEGVSANGTKYIANRQATTVTPAGSTVGQVQVEIRRISAGPGDNAMITVTGTVPGSLTTTIRCIG
jgi:hypothetical protein